MYSEPQEKKIQKQYLYLPLVEGVFCYTGGLLELYNLKIADWIIAGALCDENKPVPLSSFLKTGEPKWVTGPLDVFSRKGVAGGGGGDCSRLLPLLRSHDKVCPEGGCHAASDPSKRLSPWRHGTLMN